MGEFPLLFFLFRQRVEVAERRGGAEAAVERQIQRNRRLEGGRAFGVAVAVNAMIGALPIR